MLGGVSRRALLALALLSVTASADRARASADAVASSKCALQGKVAFSGAVYSEPTGGVQLAMLLWSPRRVEVSDLPADTAKGRAHVELRRDQPGIRVTGWMPGDSLPLTAKSELVVAADHVFIRAGHPLRVLQPHPGDWFAEPKYPSFAKVRAPLACADLALAATTSAPTDPRPSKPFFFKSKNTPLYDKPGGKVVFGLELLGATDTYQLEVRETKGAWHHFESGGAERIDGWVRAQDLVAPKEDDGGDMLGALGGLGLSGMGGTGPAPVPMTALRDSNVYLDTAKSGVVAGVLEKGAKVRAKPAAPGFSVVTLVEYDVAAPPGKSFFVLSHDLTPSP